MNDVSHLQITFCTRSPSLSSTGPTGSGITSSNFLSKGFSKCFANDLATSNYYLHKIFSHIFDSTLFKSDFSRVTWATRVVY